MKKIIKALLCVLVMQCNQCYCYIDVEGLLRDIESCNIKRTNKYSNLSVKDKFLLACNVITIFYNLYGIYTLFTEQDRLIHVMEKQEYNFLAARARMIDSLKKNADHPIGTLGIPKECEEAAQELVLLPGGKEELQEITQHFQEYYLNPNNQDNV